MSSSEVARPRPERWDRPMADDMTDALVERLLRVSPFADMDPRAFPRSTPLVGVLKNDARVVRYEPGQVVVREGDYGASAFLVLDGALRVALEGLPPEATGLPSERPSRGVGRLVAWLAGRGVGDAPAAPLRGVFVQDVPAVLGATRTATLGPGEVFGELAALSRAPRSATVFAQTGATLLETRWQGLRDLMRYSPAWREHVERLYRANSLLVHLRETPLLASLDDAALARVAAAIHFDAYGSFDWRTDLDHALDPAERLAREPVVCEEGAPADGVLLVRSGFARVSVAHGEGRRTVGYLGRGATFGAEELAVAVARGATPVWRRSLHAVGRLDVLRLPTDAFAREVLPKITPATLRRWGEELGVAPAGVGTSAARRLDFLVDRRLVNGVEAMVIDLARCTRCDDCVRACAATHDGEPRFVRQGVVHDGLQFAHACMHCVDPVCMIGCPTGAIHRDEKTGVVRVNDATCIGCSTCANSCPYHNIQMLERRDGGAIVVDEATGRPLLRATKCDLCAGRATGPACQHACPHDALVRLDLSSPTGLVDWITG